MSVERLQALDILCGGQFGEARLCNETGVVASIFVTIRGN